MLALEKKTMKKIIFLTIILTFIFSCGNKDKGELVGVKGSVGIQKSHME